MNIQDILEHLPHRYPFLLVDRVVAIEPGKFIHAYKNVTINEPHFVGHFSHYPVMPGVLIMEALAQAAGILSFKTLEAKPDPHSLFYFVGIDECRFKKPVMPGDQLHLHVEMQRQMRGVGKFKAEARVDGQIVAEAMLMCAKRDI
ncbi:MAG: 3-hydroxyacyl-ACP dehydratase FabZ [Betaproteobacteria bacterium]|nr:3-hydroxyacyl-ACP dehydratase FabZ [Betaproteobacteria bacterium]MCL2886955.1 3-hydroxyacyl-ACP dehydratase FabZ [Betaproteobacteria bacterium]